MTVQQGIIYVGIFLLGVVPGTVLAVQGVRKRAQARRSYPAEKAMGYAERKRHQIWKHQEVVSNQIRNALRPLMEKMRMGGHAGAKFKMFDDLDTGLTTIICSSHGLAIVTITLNFRKERVIRVMYDQESRAGYQPYETREEHIRAMILDVKRQIVHYFRKY